ncbi:MAG: hypothetical protein H0V29_04645, partial [Thermoleophilaceae bacterium]|nr:hypothetical protein [Thermoleophilaceae bacterium]
ATFLRRLRPVARRGRPVIARLTRAVDAPRRGGDLLDVLKKLPPLAKSSIPAFESTEKTVADAQPIVDDARPYTPDLIGGLFNGFGGATGGYYDANGHFARISAQASVYSLANFASLVPLPAAQQGLTGYRKGVIKRCPGAAQQALPDGSSPNLERAGSCNPADSPR